MEEYYLMPEPLGAAMHFVEKTNEVRSSGAEIDTAQVLASKVACVALREYFSRLVTSVQDGVFDPVAINVDDCEIIKEIMDGEGGETEADS